jgi:hemerythrin-like domain-containing protein
MRATSTAIHDRFLADHRTIEGLLESLLAAFEANDREDVQRLWTRFEESLLVHLEAEEKYLIPELRRSREHDAQELLAEHNHIRARLSALGTGIDLHIVRFEAARAFIDDLRAHAHHEDVLYAWADSHLEEQERTSLLGALTRAVRAAVGAVTDVTDAL